MKKLLDPRDVVEDLEKLLKQADFAGALAVVQSYVLSHKHHRDPTASEPAAFLDLRLASMSAEVLDYFGRYREAEELIQKDGVRCKQHLQALDDTRLRPPTPEDRRYLKQQVWLGIHLGYTYYRRNNLGAC